MRPNPTTVSSPALLILIALTGLPLASGLARAADSAPAAAYSVRAHGAVGDGQAKDTAAIQATMDACAQSGGGTVLFPPGRYLSGSLHLKSHVTLHLDAGAVLLGSKEETDYDPYEKLEFENDSDNETTYFHHALIWGEEVEDIGIIGRGEIDSNREKRGGPKPIALKRCRHVTIRDITIRNAPNYCISMLGTDYVNIDGVSLLNGYCDGIDPDCCRHVRISNCHIETWDDAIVPKASFSLGEVRSTEYLTVTNCQLGTACNAFKLGTESRGDFKYITVSNCVVFPIPGYRPPMSGIAIESVDGSHIDGVAVSNFSMLEADMPIFIRLGNRGRDMETPTPGTLRNVLISNVVARDATYACTLAGIPGHPVENISLSDIRVTYRGGAGRGAAEIDPPERVAAYPNPNMFKQLPADGLFCRHAANLTLRNIQVVCTETDLRHATVFEDVEGLNIDNLCAPFAGGAASIIRFDGVRGGFVRGCVAASGADPFLLVRGPGSEGIRLSGNDLSRASRVLERAAEVGETAVWVEGE
ncbi:MAG: hypothetical protein GHCLOJNM_03205 [bacterium]|nr:hypothetical protein [bacterium]